MTTPNLAVTMVALASASPGCVRSKPDSPSVEVYSRPDVGHSYRLAPMAVNAVPVGLLDDLLALIEYQGFGVQLANVPTDLEGHSRWAAAVNGTLDSLTAELFDSPAQAVASALLQTLGGA